MSRMKDLYTEIHELYREGMAPVNIGTKLNIPLYMVSGALAMQTTPEVIKVFDGQPVMNERIKELAEQSGLNIPVDTEYNGHIYRHALEKFAQLIVRECADSATINQHQYNSVGDYVLKHFGVEE